jgi:TetR/AcrR family transcriptional regulator
MVEPARASASTIDDDGEEPVIGTGRERILQVALEEFAANGFEGTSMAHIARRAGVTQPLVHYHFTSKDALWRAAVDNVLGLVGHGIAALRDQIEGRPPPEQLELIIRAMVRFNAACPEFGRIVAYEGALGGDRLQYLFDRQVDVPYLDVGELIAQGARDGWAKPLSVEHVVLATSAAAAYFFVIKQIVQQMYGLDVHDPETVERHADTVVELFLHGLLTNEARPHA